MHLLDTPLWLTMSQINIERSIAGFDHIVKRGFFRYTWKEFGSIMKFYPIKLYVRALPNTISLIAFVLLQLGIWGYLALNFAAQQEEVVYLHYTVLFSIDRIGPWWHVFFYPLIALIIGLINLIIGWIYYERDPLVGYICNGMTVLIHLYVAFAAYLLVFLNV